MNASSKQARQNNARLDILRQELLSPILSIEGHAELLREQITDDDSLADLQKIVTAAQLTRRLIDEMLLAETQDSDEEQRDNERSRFKHDLRNSVGAISGYSEIILEELEDADELSEDASTYLENQLADSSRLLKMLDTLFQAEREFGEDSEFELNVDISSVFDSFDRSDKETSQAISGRILVVVDNDSNRNLLTHQLRRQGHDISTTFSGRAALDMTPLIQKYDGVIDEFLGDAILAVFGAPVMTDDHARQAVACALEMQQAMAEVNHNNRQWGLPGIEMGIALNTGEVVVGNIGSETRSKYGVVGHHVNLTARIESFIVGGQVMASEYTVGAIDTDVTIAHSMQVEAKGIKVWKWPAP